MKKGGFTLVEMLLACVLASLLSVAAMQVMRKTLVEGQEIAIQQHPMSGTWLLREQIAGDIQNARAYNVAGNTMMLGGFLTRDLKTGIHTQQLSVVTYQIVPRGRRLALERTEMFLNSGGTPHRETLWYGVGGMVAFPKAEFIDGRQSVIPELQQIGLRSLTHGMSFRLTDPDGKLLVGIQ
jgi:prepilin-type N-terminal cleavage/methylation domain-containing protein